MKKIILTLLLCISIFCSLGVQAHRQETLSKNVIRLHVIANSDSKADQAVKLLVRDTVLNAFQAHTKNHSKTEAEQKIRAELRLAEQTANRVLAENGFSYDAHAEYGVYDFPTRTYGNVTLPAGSYNGLRVRLGAGNGKNWWCVMYPPLCFNDLNTTVTENETETITFEVKFKFLEFLRSL